MAASITCPLGYFAPWNCMPPKATCEAELAYSQSLPDQCVHDMDWDNRGTSNRKDKLPGRYMPAGVVCPLACLHKSLRDPEVKDPLVTTCPLALRARWPYSPAGIVCPLALHAR